MALFAALIYSPEPSGPPSQEEMMAEIGEYMAFGEMAKDHIRGGEALEPSHTATTITIPSLKKGGEVSMTDGPFAETKEVLGGFYLLECKDLDEALKVAAQIPGAWRGGRVEVRPCMSIPDQ